MSLTRRKGFYRQEVNKTVWELPRRYTSINPVGSGAYGSVCGHQEACRPFQSEIFAKRSYRELMLLKHMQHENGSRHLLHEDTREATSFSAFQDFYLVMPYMRTDLQKIMGHESVGGSGIDLKPGNLAVNEDCELKVDLGLWLGRHADAEMTGYVVTRWYRAPEVILNWMHYNQTVDIWSVGCIMAEMLTGKTLFKGKDCILSNWVKLLWVAQKPPTPRSSQTLYAGHPKYHCFTHLAKYSHLSAAVDLLDKMLQLDVEKRLTATEALAHPYFDQFRDIEEETEAQQSYDDSLEHEKLSVDEWRRHTYNEIQSFSPIARKDSKRRSGMSL
uniref:mitogen-activated protein kinase n=1 Tax=Gopherus evgoodei TaxID=1825980 RepID=A0A8C4VHB7_9SAUR